MGNKLYTVSKFSFFHFHCLVVEEFLELRRVCLYEPKLQYSECQYCVLNFERKRRGVSYTPNDQYTLFEYLTVKFISRRLKTCNRF